MPSSSWSRRISSRRVSRTLASSADSGSSSSSTRGAQGERPGQRDALLLAAGELVRVARRRGRRGPTRSSSSAARARRSAVRDLAHPQPEGDVVEGVRLREEAVGLEDHARVAAVGRDPGDVLAVDQHLARVGVFEARRRIRSAVVLPQPDGPSRASEFAGLDGQVEAVEGDGGAERPAQPAELDGRRGRRSAVASGGAVMVILGRW